MFSATEYYITDFVRVINKDPKDKTSSSWVVGKGFYCLNKKGKVYEFECRAASNYDPEFRENCYMTLPEAFKLCIELYGDKV